MAAEINEKFRSAALPNCTAEPEELRAKKQGRFPKLGKRP